MIMPGEVQNHIRRQIHNRRQIQNWHQIFLMLFNYGLRAVFSSVIITCICLGMAGLIDNFNSARQNSRTLRNNSGTFGDVTNFSTLRNNSATVVHGTTVNTSQTGPTVDTSPTGVNINASDFMSAKETLAIIEKIDEDAGEIVLHDMNIKFLYSNSLEKRKTLRILILRGNPLVIPSDKVWIYQPFLTHLDISDCNLSALDPIVFMGMKSLKTVAMQNNPGCVATRERAHGFPFKIIC